MNAQDSDGEADSLFGSPPSSPAPEYTRGGSPALALPGSLCAPCPILPELPKNVGTIALPGSHNSSELSVSLPASPRMQPLRSTHPAVPAARRYQFEEWIGPRASSLPASTTQQPKRRKKKKAKSATLEVSTSSSTPALSCSSDTHLPHYLRNQQALLGLAGVVGGVSPSNISCHNNRGSTKQNPIIVDEETPPVSTRPWKAPQSQGPTDEHSQAIADTLISQGNIFPVLQSFMPYFGLNTNVGCCSGQALQQHRSHDGVQSNSNITAPPLKRRKLNSVPAGAKDWDVPYPFPANEGPPNYLESWKKKRGKRLMMQLVLLVREAVQKASAKSRAHEADSSVADAKEQHPSAGSRSSDVLMDDAPCKEVPLSQNKANLAAPSAVSLSDQAMFSDIFAPSGFNLDPGSDFSSDFDSLLSAVNDALSNPDVQLTGNDLATMSSYPFSPTLSTSPSLTASTRLPTPCDSLQLSTIDDKENQSFNMQDFCFDDIPIDPNLLNPPWPGLPTPTIQNLDGGLPIPSIQQVVPHADPGQERTSDATFRSESVDGFPIIPADDATKEATPCSPRSVTDSRMDAPSIDTTQPTVLEGSKETVLHTTRSQTPNVPMEIQFKLPMMDEIAVRGQRTGNASSSKKLDRQGVLRRARIRREQLAAEIARAKIELWETTIEQGVLTHLSKDKELQPNT